MYGCESWTIKKTEIQGTDAFELWWWRQLLRVPWTARRSNQSIPKENNPEYSLEGLRLKLNRQYLGYLMWRADSLEKTDAREDWGQEEKGMIGDEVVGRHHCLSGHEFEQAPGDGEGQGRLAFCNPWGCKELDTTEWLNNGNCFLIVLETGRQKSSCQRVDNWLSLSPWVVGGCLFSLCSHSLPWCVWCMWSERYMASLMSLLIRIGSGSHLLTLFNLIPSLEGIQEMQVQSMGCEYPLE